MNNPATVEILYKGSESEEHLMMDKYMSHSVNDSPKIRNADYDILLDNSIHDQEVSAEEKAVKEYLHDLYEKPCTTN